MIAGLIDEIDLSSDRVLGEHPSGSAQRHDRPVLGDALRSRQIRRIQSGRLLGGPERGVGRTLIGHLDTQEREC